MTEHIQLLDDMGAEFARVSAEAERGSRKSSSRSRTLTTALGILALLCGTTYAVPTTRAAVDGIAGPIAAWVAGGDDTAPGRAVMPSDNKPPLFNASQDEDVRLIAQAEGVGLYMGKSESPDGTPMLSFSLGQGFGMGGPLESWRERLDRHTVYVLGNSIFGGERRVLDDQGRVPLFGLTTRDVKRVELRYVEGPSLVSDNGDGGFVLLVDAWRPMHEIVGYGADGQVLGSADVSQIDLRYLCDKEPGCPPGAWPSSP